MQYIRVDANATIGMGHLMRMISVAKEFKEHNEDVVFITSDEYSTKTIHDSGFESICLNTKWDCLDKEIPKMQEVIVQKKIRLLIIDSYYVSAKYLESLGKLTQTIYFDDIDKFLYPVDILFNYNIYAKNINYEKKYHEAGLKTKFALGPKYLPLRREFSFIESKKYESVSRVLISTGATDNYNITALLLEGLYKNKWYGIHFDVIVGKFNSHKEELEKKWGNNENVKLLYDVSNMYDYMKTADIAISAAGVTLYELCACSVPTITYVIADNQIDAAKEFTERGIMLCVGDMRENTENKISELVSNLEELLDNKSLREVLGQQAHNVVDGQGVSRIYNFIKEQEKLFEM